MDRNTLEYTDLKKSPCVCSLFTIMFSLTIKYTFFLQFSHFPSPLAGQINLGTFWPPFVSPKNNLQSIFAPKYKRASEFSNVFLWMVRINKIISNYGVMYMYTYDLLTSNGRPLEDLFKMLLFICYFTWDLCLHLWDTSLKSWNLSTGFPFLSTSKSTVVL